MRKAITAVVASISLVAQPTALLAEGAEGKPRDPRMGNPTLPSESCDAGTTRRFVPANTTIAFVTREVGGICRVNGSITTQNPGPNRVNFVLAMPDNFNGRYVFLGVGGAAGQLPAMKPSLLAKGYALAASEATVASASGTAASGGTAGRGLG